MAIPDAPEPDGEERPKNAIREEGHPDPYCSPGINQHPETEGQEHAKKYPGMPWDGGGPPRATFFLLTLDGKGPQRFAIFAVPLFVVPGTLKTAGLEAVDQQQEQGVENGEKLCIHHNLQPD